MEIRMDYLNAYNIVKESGFEGFFNYIIETYPELNAFRLYSMSKDWYTEGREYICKCKGARGDLLIYWS